MKFKNTPIFHISLIFILFLFLTHPGLSQVVTNLGKIMPLGDSITLGQGVESISGYRGYLYENLTKAGYTFDFVGSVNSPSSNLPVGQKEFQGYGGWQIQNDVINGDGTYHDMAHNIKAWVDATHPDYILLHIGTNDLSNDPDSTLAIQQIKNLIRAIVDPNFIDPITGQLAGYAPNAQLIVAQITPGLEPKYEINYNLKKVEPYNQAILDFTEEMQDKGFKVSTVDMYNALNPDGDIANKVFNDIGGFYPADATPTLAGKLDDLHPNKQGYKKMADVWADGIMATVIPEPSTYAMIFFTFCALLFCIHRRNKNSDIK